MFRHEQIYIYFFSIFWYFYHKEKWRWVRFLVLIAHSPKHPGSNPSGCGRRGLFLIFLACKKRTAKTFPGKERPEIDGCLSIPNLTSLLNFFTRTYTNREPCLFTWGFPMKLFAANLGADSMANQLLRNNCRWSPTTATRCWGRKTVLKFFRGSRYWNSPSRSMFLVTWKVGLGENCWKLPPAMELCQGYLITNLVPKSWSLVVPCQNFWWEKIGQEMATLDIWRLQNMFPKWNGGGIERSTSTFFPWCIISGTFIQPSFVRTEFLNFKGIFRGYWMHHWGVNVNNKKVVQTSSRHKIR